MYLHHSLEETYCYSSPGVCSSIFEKLCSTERAINELSKISKYILFDSLPEVNQYVKLIRTPPGHVSVAQLPEDDILDLYLSDHED